jgi:adenylylsulfate kinase
MKILVMGLPGAGKTTLSKALTQRLGAVHFNADEIRANINRDLGFSPVDRVEQARRMGWLCDRVVEAGGTAVADFICPTGETREAFGPAFIVWVNRIQEGRFEDTNRMFLPPRHADVEVTGTGTPEFWAEKIAAIIRPAFDWTKPTALFVGRYQPFHDGHRAIIVKGLEKIGQACVAVRQMPQEEKNPFGFEYVKARIEGGLSSYRGRFVVVAVPNISHILYGRDVGYAIERIELDQGTEAISATRQRELIKGGS